MLKSQESDENLASHVERFLAEELPRLDDRRRWHVDQGKVICEFGQYRHLGELDALVAADETGMLENAIGSGFLVRPDVTVGVDMADGRPFLHAAISCKWTIRSDRVQNIRHEGVILTRHRRGRQPHIVTVTAEPLPSRLAAIARGTGEVDCVYHVAFDELVNATEAQEDPDQRRILDVLIAQERLMRFEELVGRLLM
jgi:NgoMIV restriction enzyme